MNKPTIWIFAIEPHTSRYTSEWYEHLPILLTNELGAKFNVVQLDGQQKNTAVTPGAFLNFSDTNYWKSSQLLNFLNFYNANKVSANDHFLFTDAWNPVILQIKYMKELLKLNWTLHGLWHAGSYDKNDFLGRLIGNSSWVRNTEMGMFYSLDHNYFATKFHEHMFLTGMNICSVTEDKIVTTGWPMEYLKDVITPFVKNTTKRNLILFPHRIAPEKQVEIFRDLAVTMPEYEWVVCQDQNLSKDQYHKLLAEAKIVFSANLQETLGISTCAEATLAGAVPLAPDRLSYTEIFRDYQEFLYPSNWTLNYAAYIENKHKIRAMIHNTMQTYPTFKESIRTYNQQVLPKFFSAGKLIDTIRGIV